VGKFGKFFFGERIFCHTLYSFWKKKSPKIEIFFSNFLKFALLPTSDNMMRACLRIFYVHILSIAKFGYIFLWMIATWATSQIWESSLLAPYKRKKQQKPGSSILSRLSLAAQSFYSKNCWWPFLALVPKFLKSKIFQKKRLEPVNNQRSISGGGSSYKEGIINTMALPIDKMLYIYLLCPHSEHQNNLFQSKQSKHFHQRNQFT
jgi:hypothetical protein